MVNAAIRPEQYAAAGHPLVFSQAWLLTTSICVFSLARADFNQLLAKLTEYRTKSNAARVRAVKRRPDATRMLSPSHFLSAPHSFGL
jgi:hypothetical protein